MDKRISPANITDLNENEIFVFGSNLSGIHGGGAAYLALNKFGAIWKQGVGSQGQCYAIPTKDKMIETLPLQDIKVHVENFIDYAKIMPHQKFLVTEIGCGLAGYEVKDIAPLFRDALKVENIFLPERFIDFLTS